MHSRINLKAVLWLLGSTVALVLSVHFLHAYQMQRNAQDVLEQARLAEQEGEATRAAFYLGEYLGLVPDDVDALSRLGLLLRKQARKYAEKERALYVLDKVLRRDPSREEVRREALALALDIGHRAAAQTHLDALQAAHREDPELMMTAAHLALASKKYEEAAKWYNTVTLKKPDQVEAFIELADVYRRGLDKPVDGRNAIEAMLTANPRSSKARLAAIGYYLATRYVAEAERELRFALEQLKDASPEVYLLAGELALVRNDAKEARRHLEEGLRRHPNDTRLGEELAQLELRQGRPKEAVDRLQPALKHLPDKPEELWVLGNTLIDAGATDKLPPVLDRLAGESAAYGEHLQARLEMQQRAWSKARTRLEKVRLGRLAGTELDKHVNLLLAECHGRLGNPDAQIVACRRALAIERDWPPAGRLLAAALLSQGKLDDAIQQYGQVAGRAPEVRVELARLLILRNLRQRPEARDWAAVDQLLTALGRDGQKVPGLALLRAEVLAGKEELDQAERLAEAEAARDPSQVEPWYLLVQLAAARGPAEAVLPILDKAEKKTGRRAEWGLARARYWAGVQSPERARRLREIEESIHEYPTDQQGRLAQGLGGILLALGDAAAAERLFRRAAECDPDNLGVRIVLLERALETDKKEDVQRLQEEIRKTEGGSGPVSAYAEAARRADQAGRERVQEEAVHLRAEARKSLAAAAAARPTWARLPLLEALLCEQEGRRDRALEKYQEAIDRGEGRLPVVRRALQLLYEQGRYTDANALLRKMPDSAQSSPLLEPLAIQLSAVSGEGPDGAGGHRHALELAQKAARDNHGNYLSHLWLGQAALLAGKTREAGDAFAEARKLAPEAPDTWAALILFLAGTDKARAEQELRAARGKLPADKAALALAPCCEALGKTAEAEAEYRKALEASPRDARVLSACASFYLRNRQPDRAERLLNRILEAETKAPEGIVAQSRRDLALVLVGRGTYPDMRQALGLLDENARGGGANVFDQRTRGLVLAQHPAHRREAIELLERSSGSNATPPLVRLVLARLHEAEREWPLAAAHLRALVRREPDNPTYLAVFIRSLLRNEEISEAREWVDRLAKAAPNAPECVELRARVLKAEKKEPEAIRLVKDYAKESGARLDLAAALLEELGDAAEAERLYREQAAVRGKPESALALALFLGRQRRLGEALEVWEKTWTSCPPGAVARCGMALLRGTRSTAEQRQLLERRLTAMMQMHPEDLMYPLLLAELYENHSRVEEAMGMYRKVLQRERDGRNLMALNNLAFLLAVGPGSGEDAPALITAAVEQYGPLPALLDTRAVVHLKAGQPDLAVKDLREAVRLEPTPERYFHLAQAYRQSKNRQEAAQAFRQGKEAGLKAASLHPLEAPALDALSQWLEEGTVRSPG